MRILALAFVAALLLAGCSGSSKDSSSTTTTSHSGTSTTSHSGTTTSTTSGTTTTTTSGGPGENHDPVADLSVDLAAGAPPLKVNFTVGASDPDSGDSVTWTLAFGDSTTAATGSEASKTVAHTFASAGNFTATLTVTDSHQATATKQVPVAVGAAAASPQVFSGKWTTGGPIGCEQVADGDNINQLAPQAEGVDFVTFPVDAATILHGFKVDIKPTTPGAFEVDFYDAAGNNLGYFDNGYVAPAVPGNTIQDVVPDLSATAVFFACGPGGGTFVYTAQVV